MQTYQKIATALNAIENCQKADMQDALSRWEDVLDGINDTLPSGSGFDNGTTINRDKSTHNKIVIDSAFHHMDSNGFYCGWSDLTITVKPDLRFGIDIKISFHGSRMAQRDSDYFYDVFRECMLSDCAIQF
jgi:hypothetical protein